MYSYKNSLNTNRKKQTNAYLQKQYEAERNQSYRWSLDAMIGKTVQVECQEWTVQDIEFTAEEQTTTIRELLLKNARIVSGKDLGDLSLPVLLDHIWILVGNDFCPDQEYTHLSLTGKIAQYVKKDGTKNIGIDATHIQCSNQQEKRDEKKEKKVMNVCPEELKDLNFEESETKLLNYMYLCDLVKGNSTPLLREVLQLGIAEQFGGASSMYRMFQRIKQTKYWKSVGRYLCQEAENDKREFRIDELSLQQRLLFADCVLSDVAKTYETKVGSCPGCYSKYPYVHAIIMYTMQEVAAAVAESTRKALTEEGLAKEIFESYGLDYPNGDERKFVYKTGLTALEECGYITIEKGCNGTYAQELAAYNEAMERRKKEIEKIKKEHPDISADMAIKMPEPPKNNDKIYYVGIPTPKGQLLCDWLGIEVEEPELQLLAPCKEDGSTNESQKDEEVL